MADFRDEPRLGCERRYCLLLDRLSDGRRPEGDRMTGLRDGNVVLASVLAEEHSLFLSSRFARSSPLTGTLISSFICYTSLVFGFVFVLIHQLSLTHFVIAR